MNTDNVIILTPTMREVLESLVTKCLEAGYFGDHIAAVRSESIGDIIGRQAARGCHHIWQFSDAEVEALLCGIDCCSSESEPYHRWQSRTKTVEYDNSDGKVCCRGLQAVIDKYLQDPSTALPGLYE